MDYSSFPYGPAKGPGGSVGRGGSIPRSAVKFQEQQSPSHHVAVASGYTGSPTHIAGRIRPIRGTLDDVAASNAALQYNALVHSGGLVDASAPKQSHWQTSYTVDGYGRNPHMDRLAAAYGAVTEESVPAAASALYSHYGLTQGDNRGYIASGNTFYHTATPSQAYIEAATGKQIPQTREDYQNLYKAHGYATAAALYPSGYPEGLALASGTLEGYDVRAAYTSAVNGAIEKDHLQGSTRPAVAERYGIAGCPSIQSYTQPREIYPGVASSYATPRRGGLVRRF